MSQKRSKRSVFTGCKEIAEKVCTHLILPNIGSPAEQEVILRSNFYMETRRLPVQPVTIAVHKEISMEANEESTRERLSQMSDLVAECENI